MRRAYLALSALGAMMLTLPSLGCTQCASPYDYCGPTYLGGPGELCDSRARAGSIFWSPQDQLLHDGGYAYEYEEGDYHEGEVIYDDSDEAYYEGTYFEGEFEEDEYDAYDESDGQIPSARRPVTNIHR